MSGYRASGTGVFAALMLVGAACGAALLAHVGIDLAGDFLLARDAYDGIDHRSRSEVFVIAVALGSAALIRTLWLALDEARTGRARSRPTFAAVFGQRPWRFALAVVALTIPALAGMEFFDIVADGGRLDDPLDLLGGSAWLGLGLTLPAAVFVALMVRSIANLVMGSHRALVTVISRLFALLARFGPRVQKSALEPGAGVPFRRRSILSRRCGKRGPPLRSP
jgi:hypothetical protein